MKILLIDDNEGVRALRRYELQKAFPACCIVEGDSAEMAYTLFSSESTFDAVITDNQLPDETGSQLILRLRQAGAQCPILMVTGSDDPAVHLAALNAGASGVFCGAKPKYVAFLTPIFAARNSGSTR